MVRVFLPMASPPSYSRFYYVSSPSLFGVTFLYIITSLTGSFYGTDAMTSFSESNDDLNSDEDLDMDVGVEQEEAQDANIRQEGVMQDADAQDMPTEIRQVGFQDARVGAQVRQVKARVRQVKAPIQFRTGLRSQITLGEEIT